MAGWPQAHVAQAYIVQRLELALNLRDIPKEGQRLGDAHVEHVRDGLTTVGDLKRLAVIAFAAADLTGDIDIGKEVHLDLNLSVALACFAATAAHVKGETSRASSRAPSTPAYSQTAREDHPKGQCT